MSSSTETIQLADFSIKVNGTKLADNVRDQVIDVTVEQDVTLPEAFTFRLRDRSNAGWLTLLDSETFKVGASCEIGLGWDAAPATLLKGEITSIELDARPDGDVITIVRGYDKSHRLHRARKTRTFVQMSDADVVGKVAREAGLTADAASGGPIHEHLYQDNQTDWEFLRARANALGLELFVRDQKVTMRAGTTAGSPPTHKLTESLLRLRLRLSAPSQVSTVTVRGWDPQKKEAIVGTASTPSSYLTPTIGLGQAGGAFAQSAFAGSAEYAITANNVATQDEATKLAQAVLDELAGEFIQLEGSCIGDATVAAGKTIKLAGIGEKYSGTYYVTAARHTLTPAEGYVTEFTVSGRQPQSLAALLGSGAGAAGAAAGNHRAYRGLGGSAGRHAGVVIGLVTKNKAEGNDAKYDGCVKVKFPWLDEQQESHWARVASPSAGASRGFLFLPEVNDEVLVAFEHGDINRPYILGTLWNGKDAAPKKASELVASDGKVKQRIIKSRTGHTILLDDSDDAPGITIIDKESKNSVKIDSKENKITITSEKDLEITAKGAITLKGKGVAIEATSDDVSVKGNGVTVDAKTGAVTAKGGNATLEAATGKVTVKGATGADVQTNAVLNIKGTMVNIN